MFFNRKNIGKLNRKRRERSAQCFAVMLCIALCLENGSLTALAAEPVSQDETEMAENMIPQDPDEGETEAAGETGIEAPEEPTEGTEGGAQEPTEGEPEMEPQQPEEPKPEEPQEPTEGELEEPQEPEKPEEPIEEEPQMPETVSENTTISENTLETISENSLDDERKAMVQAAAEAFAKLLSEKPLMALLYHTDRYALRREADRDSAAAATLEIGQTLYLKGVTITEDDVWYRVQYFLNGAEGAGYVQSYYLAYADEDWIAWEEKYLLPILEQPGELYQNTAYGMSAYSVMPYAASASEISAFPGSYQSALRSLKNAHPNWIFVPTNTGLDFNSAVSNEMGDKSLIQNTSSNASKGWVGAACPKESGWYYATKPAVAYYMDPRNFLTETYMFQFEQLTFNASYHTESAVQGFLNGTFMKGKLADDSKGRTYAQAFFEIGKNRKLSPVHLASRVYQEQGQGTSGLISGTYPGYEGYYNFFNVGVNGSSTAEKIVKGLTYARNKGWNTRYLSLEGGAGTIGNNYILKGQDTIYLEKFNVAKDSQNAVYTHQYMQNIQAPASEASSTKKMYTNAGSLNNAFVFKIPVYNNMPDEAYYPVLGLNKASLSMNKGEEQQLILSADGNVLDGSEADWRSSDPSVVTVQNGTVLAAGAGEAVVTAAYQEVEISCKITVKVPLQGIILDKTEIRLRRPDTVVEDTTGLSETEKAENTDTATLQVSFDPPDTTVDQTIVWTSANKKIATVTADSTDPHKAVVHAVGTGTVKITAKASKAGNKTAVCTVQVSAPIYKLELVNRNALETDPADQATLFAGQSINLSAEYWPKDTTSDTQVVWSSSDEKATVVKDGRVTAVGEDAEKTEAVITAKIGGSEKGYEAVYRIKLERCTVTFMDQKGTKKLGTETVPYGGRVSAEAIQAIEKQLGAEPKNSRFIGWYTGVEGAGSRFDENSPVHQKNITLYPYYARLGEGFYVLPIGNQTYTGSAVKPVVQVYDSVPYENGERDEIELVLNRDYTVSYQNNKNVNAEGKAAPTVTVKGKGNYSGTQKVSFQIVPKALTDTDITADDITVAYSGRVIKSAPTVYRNGKKLARNRDYTVTYPLTEPGAYQTAGTHPIVITGKGGYTGRITVYEKITKDVLLSKVSVAGIPKQTYSSEQLTQEGGIRPASLNVTYKKQPLVEGEHYTVTYSNDQSIGKATATLTAVEGSGYIGSRSVTYQIVGTPLARAKVTGLENKIYAPIDSGLDAESEEYEAVYREMLQTAGTYSLTLNDTVLEESPDGIHGDYVVSYAGAAKRGAVKAGTATIIFQGINAYSGQLKKTYRILPCELSEEQTGAGGDITLSYYTQDAPDTEKALTDLNGVSTPYVKGGSKPTVLLKLRRTALTPGKDYTISYKNNTALTTEDMEEKKLPTFTITGKGNFKGKLSGTFTITDGRIQDKAAMTAKDVVYREKRGAYQTKATLKDVDGKALAAGKDYEKKLRYTYVTDTKVLFPAEEELIFETRRAGDAVGDEDIPQAGTAIRVTAQGCGAYAGTEAGNAVCSAVYRIVAADLSKVKVKVGNKEYLNGRPVLLTAEDLTLTVNGVSEPLVLGEDYVIDEATYLNHTAKGKAKVTLRGVGNYGGEKTVTYIIGAKKLWW